MVLFVRIDRDIEQDSLDLPSGFDDRSRAIRRHALFGGWRNTQTQTSERRCFLSASAHECLVEDPVLSIPPDPARSPLLTVLICRVSPE
jgi:hypothetical protein